MMRWRGLVAVLTAVWTLSAWGQEDARGKLKPFNALVGEWKGTAQPQDKDSKRKRVFWKEVSDWSWAIKGDQASLVWTVKDSKKIKKGTLTHDPASKGYKMVLELADGSTPTLKGELDGSMLTLEGKTSEGELQLQINMAGNDDRFMYYLSKKGQAGRFLRDLETGNTRAGVTLAGGAGGAECIVTGGKGTIKISYKGQDYFVCCSGCKQAFEENPEKYIAEYKAKKK